MRSNIRIAQIQIDPSENKKENNIKTVSMIKESCKKGADIVVLPEMFNFPYGENPVKYAENQNGETYRLMSETARKEGIYLIAGSVAEKEGDEIYNTCYSFDPEGNLIGKHRKVHMFDIEIKDRIVFRESDTISPGNHTTVIDTKFGKIGIMICYDIRFPEFFRKTVEKGVNIVVIPANFNMTTGPAHWEILLRMRAVDNQVFTIGCSTARNRESKYTVYGNSMIVSPWGEILGRLDENEGILITDIDTSETEHIKSKLQFYSQFRRDIYDVNADR